ncbi:hypothetical protein D5S12_14040 [Pseudomonas syringae]|nr:hypothetical protein D5S12_14040 [Pseudomonas syringae]
MENRARFAQEVVDAAVEAIGSERVGIRIFPSGPFQGILAALKDPELPTLSSEGHRSLKFASEFRTVSEPAVRVEYTLS